MTRLDTLADQLDRALAGADAALLADYPGDRGVRQPVHTVYVPGDRYTADTVPDWAEDAKATLAHNGGSVLELAEALDLRPSLAVEVYDRVRAKLDREPIEDLRIDFEDGYGNRPDAEEDAPVADGRPPGDAACARSTSSSVSWRPPAGSPTAS